MTPRRAPRSTAARDRQPPAPRADLPHVPTRDTRRPDHSTPPCRPDESQSPNAGAPSPPPVVPPPDRQRQEYADRAIRGAPPSPPCPAAAEGDWTTSVPPRV